MKDRFAVSMFGQKRLSREGGIEIVVKELCTRMARDGCIEYGKNLMKHRKIYLAVSIGCLLMAAIYYQIESHFLI